MVRDAPARSGDLNVASVRSNALGNRHNHDLENLALCHDARCLKIPARKRGRPVDGKYVGARGD